MYRFINGGVPMATAADLNAASTQYLQDQNRHSALYNRATAQPKNVSDSAGAFAAAIGQNFTGDTVQKSHENYLNVHQDRLNAQEFGGMQASQGGGGSPFSSGSNASDYSLSSAPEGFGGSIAPITTGQGMPALGYAFQDHLAKKMQGQGQTASQQMPPIQGLKPPFNQGVQDAPQQGSGLRNASLIGMMNDPAASPQAKSALGHILQQRLKNNAPITAYQQAGIDNEKAGYDLQGKKLDADLGYRNAMLENQRVGYGLQARKLDADLEHRSAMLDLQKAQAERGGRESFGVNPIVTYDSEGNQQIYQLGNRGSMNPVQLPDGQKYQKYKPTTIDTGTGTTLVDDQGNEVGSFEKNLIDKKQQEELGKAIAAKQQAIPTALNTIDSAIKYIEQMETHPGLDAAVGTVDGHFPTFGADARDFEVRLDQLKGKVFLSTREALKGAGAVTDFEGLKGEVSELRGDLTQGQDGFRTSLKDLKNDLLGKRRLLIAETKLMQMTPEELAREWQNYHAGMPNIISETENSISNSNNSGQNSMQDLSDDDLMRKAGLL